MKRKIDQLNRAFVKEEGIKREAVDRKKRQQENGTSHMNDPEIVDLDGVKIEPAALIQKIVKTEGNAAAGIVQNLVLTGELPATEETRKAIKSSFVDSALLAVERTLSLGSPGKISQRACYSRNNDSTHAQWSRNKLVGQGTFKNVYSGAYVNGDRKGQACVAKVFKSGSVFENSFFSSELEVIEKAMEIINMFNAANFTTQRVWLNKPTIWMVVERADEIGDPS